MSRRLSFGMGASVLVAGIGISAPAAAQDRLTVDASLSGGVASNPFLENGGNTPTTASATLSISPAYLIDRGLTRFELRGDATITEYLKRYPNSDSFGVSASGSHRVSERTSLNAQLGYTNSVVGAFNDLGVAGTGIIIPSITPVLPAAAADPNTVIQPALTPPALGIGSNLTTDPSLGGIGRRRQSYTGGAGFSTGLGERDRVDFGVSVVASRARAGALDDFNYVAPHLGYRRAIRQGLDITADVGVGHANYLRTRQGDATTFSPSLGTSYRIAEGTSLNLSVGVTIVQARLLQAGASRTTTSFSGQASLCKQDSRWNACISGSRAALPSAAQGVRLQTAVSLSAGIRLSERDTLSASSSYSRSGAPLGVTPTTVPIAFSTRTEYLSLRGQYDRRLSQRLFGFVSAGAAKAYGDQRSSGDPSYEARVGVRIRFGDGR